ncbi:MAG: hypothetical protein GY820_33515 [Gammaproteobacteria bacterium]|nr:hypothetical protein [Gammaproteobacteria bacterium]
MESVLNDFKERVKEIDEYINLLQMISQPFVEIRSQGKKANTINNVAIKAMKASCFLMLYNLVESSIRGSMIKLYEKMNFENQSLSDFDQFVKNPWINQRFKNLDPFSSHQLSYRNLIKSMIEEVLIASPVILDPELLPISGNLDARKIRELFDSHNIPTHVHYRSFHGAELNTVKDKRNALAHGSESFSDCGQQYSVQSIISIKRQTVIFLRRSLKNVQKYIDGTRHAA